LSVASQLHSVGASGFMRRLDAARAANLPVVAVGAESQAAMNLCVELGFTRLQGKIISMPVSVERSIVFLDHVGAHGNDSLPDLIHIPDFTTNVVASQPVEIKVPEPAQPVAMIPVARSVGLTMFSLDFVSNDDDPASTKVEAA
jgi:hypothetical protein